MLDEVGQPSDGVHSLLHGLRAGARFAFGRIVGSLHGALFVAYAVCAGLLLLRGQWTFARASAAMGVSLVPFATFFFDRSIRDELAALEDGVEKREPGVSG